MLGKSVHLSYQLVEILVMSQRVPVSRNERYCPFCSDSVEHESHFLFDCPQYDDTSEKCLFDILNQSPDQSPTLNERQILHIYLEMF